MSQSKWIKVFCAKCNEHIYDVDSVSIIANSMIRAADFRPIDPSQVQPVDNDAIVCPKCKEMFLMKEGTGYRVNTEKGLLPEVQEG